MNIGIVGHEAAKFTAETEIKARDLIRDIIRETSMHSSFNPVTVISGRCPLGGIDIWAIEEAIAMGCSILEFPPAVEKWEGGYKQRNMLIAAGSEEVHNILVSELPASYTGMTFKGCYHCNQRIRAQVKRGATALDDAGIDTYLDAYGYRDKHIKSGGCWTTWYAIEKFGKRGYWHVIV